MSPELTDLKQQAQTYIESQLPSLFELLETLVNINSHSENIAGVNQVQKIIASELESLGMHIEYFDFPGSPKALIARSPACSDKNIIFSLHADTVYPEDSEFQKLEDHGDKFIGPGVFDLKGAIVSMIGAMRSAKELGILEELPISVLITPDEETNSLVGNAVVEKIASETAAALVMEYGRDNDDIIINRYGFGGLKVEVSGKSAHSGNDFQNGANAVVQLSHTLQKLSALSDVSKYTFNVTAIESPKQLNVVPDWATAKSDLRLPSMSYMPEIEEQLRSLEEDILVPGTSVKISLERLSYPVEEVEGSESLLTSLIKASHEAGLKSGKCPTSRGGSDANIFAKHGVLVADGLGPAGGCAHIPGKEYLLKESVAPKTCALINWMLNEREKPKFSN